MSLPRDSRGTATFASAVSLLAVGAICADAGARDATTPAGCHSHVTAPRRHGDHGFIYKGLVRCRPPRRRSWNIRLMGVLDSGKVVFLPTGIAITPIRATSQGDKPGKLRRYRDVDRPSCRLFARMARRFPTDPIQKVFVRAEVTAWGHDKPVYERKHSHRVAVQHICPLDAPASPVAGDPRDASRG